MAKEGAGYVAEKRRCYCLRDDRVRRCSVKHVPLTAEALRRYFDSMKKASEFHMFLDRRHKNVDAVRKVRPCVSGRTERQSAPAMSFLLCIELTSSPFTLWPPRSTPKPAEHLGSFSCCGASFLEGPSTVFFRHLSFRHFVLRAVSGHRLGMIDCIQPLDQGFQMDREVWQEQ